MEMNAALLEGGIIAICSAKADEKTQLLLNGEQIKASCASFLKN